MFKILDGRKDSDTADVLAGWAGAADLVQTTVLPVATLGAYNVDLASSFAWAIDLFLLV